MTPAYSKIFVNGTEKITINETGSNKGYHDDFSFIGAKQVSGSPKNFFKGKLDEIRIYNRVLSDTAIQTLYSSYNITGINDIENSKISIYPNPAKDYIIINTGNYSEMQDYSIKIVNQFGTTIFETRVTQPQYEINISKWSGKGVYVLQLYDSKKIVKAVKKIILQ